MHRIAYLLLAATAASPALAQEPAYLDDRSGPSALVRSLYNAIERKEYTRAWSYFSEQPAESVEAYARGYEDTEGVNLVVGTAREEGAAGSIYYEVPVAIEAFGSGPSRVFAGCYTLRMADPSVGEDFEPLHIERGALEPFDGMLDEALPRRCGDGPEMPEHNAGLEKAKAMLMMLDGCYTARVDFDDSEEIRSEIHSIGFRYDFDEDDRPDRVVKLYRFLCSMGAYNFGHAYFLENEDGDVTPLHFAKPVVDIRYSDGQRTEAKVESLTLMGFATHSNLINSSYDPETRTISSTSWWRGMGDASESGKWMFRQGEFVLVHYEVDGSYDREMNPEVVVDYDTGP